MTNDDNQIVEGRRKAKPQMANGEPQNPKLRLKESQNEVGIKETREKAGEKGFIRFDTAVTIAYTRAQLIDLLGLEPTHFWILCFYLPASRF